LARKGYRVHLIDAWPPRVEAGAAASREHPDWFTLTFFHRPDELRDVDSTASRCSPSKAPVPARRTPTGSPTPTHRRAVLRAIRRVEAVPELLGASPHLLAIGHTRK
jgi:hypothetical protein